MEITRSGLHFKENAKLFILNYNLLTFYYAANSF